MTALVAAAPKISECLCEACEAHFAAVRRISTQWASRTELNRRWSAGSTTTPGPRSSSTAAAPRASSRLWVAAAGTTVWSNCSVAAPTPGIGFALGPGPRAAGAGGAGRRDLRTSPAARRRGPARTQPTTVSRLRVASLLRAEGLSVPGRTGRHGKLGRSLETASKEHAHFAVIIGDELAEGNVQLKDLEAGTQRLVPLADLARELAPRPPRATATAEQNRIRADTPSFVVVRIRMKRHE